MPPQAASVKTENAAQVSQVKSVQAKSGQATYCPTFPTKPRSLRPEKQPKDFDLQQGSEFKRAETKLREKPAAEKGWKQDVSNPPLSRSDLAGHLSERRA
ncbi:hypothetical protein [Desulfitobacterium hafniense]|uniref:hypothetical protein n=1 Tax=Desulfitobacterium hafniense TaxID=49338 RepID=UPI0006810A4F|nr:hypothetical protein [Desulfitobacterium hafniense]